jgi:uncharacterized membrane protein
MASLSQAKTYGGIGSILVLLAPVPALGWILAIAGFVLTLVAVKYISEVVKNESIMNNMIVSIVAAVAGIVIGFFVILGSFMRFVGLNNLVGPDYFGANFNPASVPVGDWIGLATAVLVGIAAMWVLLTISGVYLRRGYSKIGSSLNVSLFGTAGLLFLVGAATTIILVGFLLIPIALILLAIAFFSINDSAPGTVQSSAIQTQTS